jgi:hypothetical protein
MSQSLQASLMIRAQKLARTVLSALALEDLVAHRDEVMRTLLELAGVRVVGHGMSANAMAHLRHIGQKLLAHLQLLREMIEDQQAAQAAQQSDDEPAPAVGRRNLHRVG